ncbi:TlpA family protein disulfide reductase [Saccharicrinis fermentans]|uniref:Thiol-disulfide oxidoreductase ResA n=1 Tax=Saccharicrinis fermentans DSM 9555 = JCM 21142 TaxID=869213 RepID=W7YIE6_9BACT|nr:TlpA disulfide reductase family protein [Saccharicrinis fermentans]GAF04251.1 thiol-disulfide oxidoreductase ResA [Saccharicrinis fermentans DSM 9555 = JCM 21142]
MKNKITTLLLIHMIFVVSCVTKKEDDRGYIVKVGDKAPDYTTVLDNGDTFRLSDHKGKVVMLQFTASWCGVCRKEMPFIESEIWQVHRNKDFVLVGIDRDEPLEKLNDLSTATGITYPLALDPEAAIFGLYALKKAGVTRNVIIDRDGSIAYMTRLFNQEEFDAMKLKIEDLLNK